MNDKTFDISLAYDGIQYQGWVTPSAEHHADGMPRSFHVVLNETMFGNLSKSGDNWVIDQQRPAAMVEQVGKLIQSQIR